MKSKKELLLEAQNEQIQLLAGHRVTVLKALDELESFNGKDDYVVSLPIIVKAYPDGIDQARIREVLRPHQIRESGLFGSWPPGSSRPAPANFW